MTDYCIASIRKYQKEMEYRAYITDMMRLILQSQQTQPLDIPRYIDLVEPQKETQPERTADEIISSISDKLAKLGG